MAQDEVRSHIEFSSLFQITQLERNFTRNKITPIYNGFLMQSRMQEYIIFLGTNAVDSKPIIWETTMQTLCMGILVKLPQSWKY
jgi:hypothetical protein